MLVRETQPTPAVGSFRDDLQELKRVLMDPSQASAVNLERLAHLLLLVSHQVAAPTP